MIPSPTWALQYNSTAAPCPAVAIILEPLIHLIVRNSEFRPRLDQDMSRRKMLRPPLATARQCMVSAASFAQGETASTCEGQILVGCHIFRIVEP
jgi:hypothetical protein